MPVAVLAICSHFSSLCVSFPVPVARLCELPIISTLSYDGLALEHWILDITKSSSSSLIRRGEEETTIKTLLVKFLFAKTQLIGIKHSCVQCASRTREEGRAFVFKRSANRAPAGPGKPTGILCIMKPVR